MKKQKYSNKERAYCSKNNLAYYYNHLLNYHNYTVHMFFEKYYLGKNSIDREDNELMFKKDLIKIESSIKYLIKSNQYETMADFKLSYNKKRKLNSLRNNVTDWTYFNDMSPKSARTNMFRSYYNLDGIEGNLFYISDRWNCTGRMLWLLKVIEKYKGEV